MTHLKRQKVPKNWPIYRKGMVYVVKPNSNLKRSIPILVILRDILKVAQNRKEVKIAIHSKHILLNNRPVKEDKIGLALFDTITIVPSKKYYRVVLSEKGKFALEEITEAESELKIVKVVNKKILKGKKIQLNFNDGKNIISDIKCKINDSILINSKDKKIKKCIKFEKNANAIIFVGKHSGEKGVISKIKPERKMVEIQIGKKSVNVLIKQLIVIE